MTGTTELDLQELLIALNHADSNNAPLNLDMSALDVGNASARRVRWWWVASVTNLLSGQFSDLPLNVALPAERSVQLQLMRGGLYHALAQRPGPVTRTASDEASDAALEASAGTWTPQKGPEPVLFEEAIGIPVARRSYLYKNTHSMADFGYFRRYQGSAAFPFLGHAIPQPHSSAACELHQMFLLSACEALVEVLDNFSTHAFNRLDSRFDAGWLGPTLIEQARSCLLVSVTAGGTNSFDRLHFIALDNGLGIPRTMRWKHQLPLQSSESANIVKSVLRERLTGRNINGHAGAGLWSLTNLANFTGGMI